MAHYTVTHTCGHESRVNLVGSHESREWRLRRMEEEVCFECHAKEQTKAAKEVAAQLELPPLLGTERQIAWAETIRVRLLPEIEAEAMRHRDSPAIAQALDAITQQTAAHQWIEWRDDTARWILSQVCKMLAKQKISLPAAEGDAAIKHDVLAQATLRPEQPVTETIAEIAVDEQVISVKFPEKREDFRELVRFQLGYSWKNERWQRTIAPRNGTVEDRATELGVRLLAAGFSVRLFREDIREHVIAGNYTPEQTRWVTKLVSGDYTGWLYISWGSNEDCYAAAKRLTRSRYLSPGVAVPPEQWEEVLDFAQRYGFSLSKLAQQVIDEQQALRNDMLVVHATPVKEKKPRTPASDIPPVLAVPETVEIDDELKDDN